jgi:hypothetical protein
MLRRLLVKERWILRANSMSLRHAFFGAAAVAEARRLRNL